ncbi:hypothetical protein L208DRAFT_1237379 [Tricholoma matsutake]|nr:hypothetical protein L208DRAFT_1237379 [Tricholoma matsutake 945]
MHQGGKLVEIKGLYCPLDHPAAKIAKVPTFVVEEVGNERKGIAVFLHKTIESSVVDTKSETTVLLLDKENRSAMWRLGWADEA